VKIARLIQHGRNAIVAGLILKKNEIEIKLVYERVERVLMTEESANYTDDVEDVILWPK
jgi:hypothetical protein